MKILLSFFLLLVVSCYVSLPLAVSFNPPHQDTSSLVANSGFHLDFQAQIAQLQKQLKSKMTELSRSLREGDRFVIFWLLGLAFLYGVIHSIGPGHGKAVIVSYLLAQGGSPRQGILLGAVAAMLHGFSAIFVVLLIYFLSLGRLTTTFSAWSSNLQTIAYALISVIGLFMLIAKIVPLVNKKNIKPLEKQSSKQSWWLFAALALIPCPGTMIVLLFFLSMKMLGFGILMAVTVAMGMAFTLSVIGLCTVLTRSAVAQQSTDRSHPIFVLAHNLLGMTGAVLVLSIGLLMLYSSIG